MADQIGIDRRRERRVDLQVPIQVRRPGAAEPRPPEQGITMNVSLAGVYFQSQSGRSYAPNDVVVASVSIPDPQQREFPFSRLAGRSRVVRVDTLPDRAAGSGKRQGIALEFGEDLTILSAIR